MKNKEPISHTFKAYKITTRFGITGKDYTVISATSAGRAKTLVVNSLREAGYETRISLGSGIRVQTIVRRASYADILTCRRSPEYDQLAQAFGSGCLMWKAGHENYRAWGAEPCHWWDWEIKSKGDEK